MRKILLSLEIVVLVGAVILAAIWFSYPSAAYGWYVFTLMFVAGGVIEFVRGQMNPTRSQVLKDLKPVFENRAFTEGIRKDTLYATLLAVHSSILALKTGEWAGRRITRVDDVHDSDPFKADLERLLKALERLSRLFECLELKRRLAKTDSAVTPLVFTGDPGQVVKSIRALDRQRQRVLELFRSLG